MTSNIGQEEFNSKASKIGFSVSATQEEKLLNDFTKAKNNIINNLQDYFSPEFINRIDKVAVFNPLDKGSIKKIVDLQLQDLRVRLLERGYDITYDNKVLNFISKKVYNPEFGAREIRRYIQDKIEDTIANLIIQGIAKNTIVLTVKKGDLMVESENKKIQKKDDDCKTLETELTDLLKSI